MKQLELGYNSYGKTFYISLDKRGRLIQEFDTIEAAQRFREEFIALGESPKAYGNGLVLGSYFEEGDYIVIPVCKILIDKDGHITTQTIEYCGHKNMLDNKYGHFNNGSKFTKDLLQQIFDYENLENWAKIGPIVSKLKPTTAIHYGYDQMLNKELVHIANCGPKSLFKELDADDGLIYDVRIQTVVINNPDKEDNLIELKDVIGKEEKGKAQAFCGVFGNSVNWITVDTLEEKTVNWFEHINDLKWLCYKNSIPVTKDDKTYFAYFNKPTKYRNGIILTGVHEYISDEQGKLTRIE